MQHSAATDIITLGLNEQIVGSRVGNVIEVSKTGKVFVDYMGNSCGKVAARFTKSLTLSDLRQAASCKQEVLLLFENNDPKRPIIIDILHSFMEEIIRPLDIDLEAEKLKDITIDGKTITFDAKERIILRCGKASITLTQAGKIIIRGANLLSRSTGANRIKGGSVQIN